MLRGEGTPIDDQRASAAYRSAMLGNACCRLCAEDVRTRGSASMSHLSERPGDAVVGLALPARERGPARHRRTRSTPTTWCTARRDVLHAHPV